MAYQFSRFLAHWFYCFAVYQIDGFYYLRFYNFLAFWFYGFMVLWFYGMAQD